MVVEVIVCAYIHGVAFVVTSRRKSKDFDCDSKCAHVSVRMVISVDLVDTVCRYI